MKHVTLNDIAERLKVSKTTVSMALHDHPRISPEMREKVRRTADEMGYAPDPFLSGLAAYRRLKGPAKNQGVMAWINHWEQPHDMRAKFREFDSYWRGAEKAAQSFGYKLDEIQWERDCSAKRLEGILTARGILGVLIPPHHSVLDWGDFDWNKFAIVRFGRSVQNPDSNLVAADHFRATVMAVERIHSYGYQRIGLVIGGKYEKFLGGNYVGGFCYAQILLKLKPALPPLLTDYGSRGEPDMVRQREALKKWLDRHQPDAVLTTDMEVPGMIRELGLRIPEDIAMAGTSVRDVPLDAGIDQRSDAIGRIAVEMLVKQINVSERGEPPEPCRILVESCWCDGKSLPNKALD